METDFSLRPATVDDLLKIVEIEKRSNISPWAEENFKAELFKPYSHFLIFTDDETDSIVAGFIIFWSMFEECQILNLAIDESYRRLGLAKQLIRKASSLAMQHGIKKVVLEVRKSNSPAIHLYQGLGFVITHIRKRFYGNGEDAYQMSLILENEPLQF